MGGSFDSEGKLEPRERGQTFIPSGQSRLDDDSDFHPLRDYTILMEVCHERNQTRISKILNGERRKQSPRGLP